MTIVIDVNGQKLSLRSQTSDIIEDSLNFVKIHFNFFDADWNNLDKRAHFIQEGITPIYCTLSDNEVYLPNEIKSGKVKVALEGIKREQNEYQIIATSSTLEFEVKSFVSEEESEPTAPEITPSVAEQLINAAETIEAAIELINEDNFVPEIESEDTGKFLLAGQSGPVWSSYGAVEAGNNLPVTGDTVKTAIDEIQASQGESLNVTVDSSFIANSENPVQSKVIQTALTEKQDTLTFDNTPMQNSNNPVTSGGLYTAIAGKQNALTFDSTPTDNSTNPVTSDGIKAALDVINDLLFYKEGDTYEIRGVPIMGHLTATRSTLFVAIPTPKFLTKISSIELVEFKAGLRGGVSGNNGMLYNSTDGSTQNNTPATDFKGDSNLTITLGKQADSWITMKIVGANNTFGNEGADNNRLIDFWPWPLKFKFHEGS